MDYDWIEVGTSDFETRGLAPWTTERGALVEPLEGYLARLPDGPNQRKVCAAVGPVDGEDVAYHVPPEVIERYGMPAWLRGCNTVGRPHPLALQELRKRGLDPDEHMTRTTVRTVTWETLIAELGAGRVRMLKTDTEGADCDIVDQVLKLGERRPALLPTRIVFETNANTPEERVLQTLGRLKSAGYRVLKRGENTTVELDDEHRAIVDAAAEPLMAPKVAVLTRIDWSFGRIARTVTSHARRWDVRFVGWDTPPCRPWTEELRERDYALFVAQGLHAGSVMYKALDKGRRARATCVCHGEVEYQADAPNSTMQEMRRRGMPVGAVSDTIVEHATLPPHMTSALRVRCGVDLSIFTANGREPRDDDAPLRVLVPYPVQRIANWDVKRLPVAQRLCSHYAAVPEGDRRVTVTMLPRHTFGHEMPDVYRAHDVVLVLANSEGNPLPALEGPACGCALVSTAVGIVPEMAGVIPLAGGADVDDDTLFETACATLDSLAADRERVSSAAAEIGQHVRDQWGAAKAGETWEAFFDAAAHAAWRIKRTEDV